jgi:hypothetical protein
LGVGGREKIGDDGEVVLIWRIFLARATRKLLNFAVAGAKLIALDNGGGWTSLSPVPYRENAIVYELVPLGDGGGWTYWSLSRSVEVAGQATGEVAA